MDEESIGGHGGDPCCGVRWWGIRAWHGATIGGRGATVPGGRTEGQAMNAPRLGFGSTLPDVTLRDLDGNPYRLGDVRGQRLLLFMWASW